MDILIRKKDISEYSNYKTPASAAYFFEVCSENDIDNIIPIKNWALEHKIPLLFVSSWTNMLFAFDNFPWIIIKNSLSWWTYTWTQKILETYSSESIWDIAESLEKDYRQDIWHRFIGLPGSIAGAIYGNAGCFWLETESNFLDCRVLDLENGQRKILSKWDMKFWYRSSLLKQEKKYYIISARFDFSQKIEKYASDVDNIYFREHMQPKWNSCWSFFKNPKVDRDIFLKMNPSLIAWCPKNISAGYLIEQVWLKGHHIGGAYMSELHANFLMHDGQGNYKDLLQMIQLVQEKVQSQFWIILEPEVQIIYP